MQVKIYRVGILAGVMCVLAMSIAAAPQAADQPALVDGATRPTLELIDKFSALAGSTDNSDALVNGLRTGNAIVLTTATGTKTTFTPSTKAMGFGNVDISLSLAQAELAKLGIVNPTTEQLQAALNGGSIATSSGPVKLPGILTLRSSGMGWGQVAHQLGFKLGEVVRSTKAERAEERDKNSRGEQMDKTRPDHTATPATPASPATAATPAIPGSPTVAAIPATPANRAIPAAAAANAGQKKSK